MLLALVLALLGTEPAPPPMPSKASAHQTVQGLDVTVYGDSSASGFIVRKQGKELYRQTGNEGFIIQADPSSDHHPIPANANLLGDGTPVLTMTSWSGGAHCCYTYYFFALTPDFHLVQKVETKHEARSAGLERRDDGRWVLRLRDWAFAYWSGGFADSFAPEVILRFDRGAFRPARDLMQKPLPETRDVIRALHDPLQWIGPTSPPRVLERTVLELLYTGHAKEAWALVDRAWPRDREGKAQWLKDFREQLATSEWYPQLAEWNAE